MMPDTISAWLKAKRKQGMASSALYAAAMIGGGVLIFGMIYWIAFMAAKLALIIAFHNFPYSSVRMVFITVAALFGAAIFCGFLFLDSIRNSRDDMSNLFIWLIREYIGLGPRMMREGWPHLARFRLWKHLDLETCGNVLMFLATRNAATPQREVLRIFPGLDWSRLVLELRLIPGVIFFQPDSLRVTLTLPLRLELRSLRAHARKVHASPPAADPEPELVSVHEPGKLKAEEILGVGPGATLAEIKLAYRLRIKECHPDRFAAMDAQSQTLAEEWTKSLNAAYETLLAQARKRG